MKPVLIVFIILFCHFSYAQGFNNNQLIDQEDLKFLFEQNKIEPFKFSFSSQSDSSVNIIVEEYYQEKRRKKVNFFEDAMKVIAMGDEPATYYFPKLNDTTKHWLRFYLDTKSKDTLYLWIKTDNITRRYTFLKPRIKMTQSRAFDDIPKSLSGRQPLFVFYGNAGGMLISCPGDASIKEVVSMYDYVLAVFAEPVKAQ